jgi:hypothetical protein
MPNYAKFHYAPELLANVIAFDPGGTTGYCIMGVAPEALTGKPAQPLFAQLSHIEYGEIDCGTKHGQTGAGMNRGHDGLNMPGEYDGIVKMMNLREDFQESPIVVEDFVLDVHKANRGRDLLLPVRIIAGFSTLLQYSFGPEALSRIFIQNRSLAKTTCTDERLRNWGMYDTSSGAHSRDATRHAFYFLRNCSGDDSDARYKRHLAWPHLFDDPAIGTMDRPAKTKRQAGQRITSLS